jgi:hypothetical protein
MKCPYNVSIETEQTVFEYDKFGFQVFQQTIVKSEMPDCIKEECAAWCDGKCHYKG